MSESLLDRLRNPAWCHSEAPFDSPQLAKEETINDMAAAADEIERLCDVMKAWDAQLFASGLEAKHREMWTNIERERCAQIAILFGDFPGGSVVKDIRVMCGRAIADKIREGITTPVGNALHPYSPGG